MGLTDKIGPRVSSSSSSGSSGGGGSIVVGRVVKSCGSLDDFFPIITSQC